MLTKNIVKRSLIYAGLALAYISGVANLMFRAERVLNQLEENVLMPIGFLLLLVVSVATMGLLIFGHPVMLYIDGHKRDGVIMAITTVASLAMFTGLLFTVLILVA